MGAAANIGEDSVTAKQVSEALIARDIQGLILTVRGEKVILDCDLAALYGMTTRVLNQAVRRHIARFPMDFAFQLSPSEFENLKSQIVISSCDERRGENLTATLHGGRRKLPLVFTEHGALMAANVLRSRRAVEMSVFIVRAFVRMRGALVSQYEMSARLEQIEKVLLVHDDQLRDLFDTIRPLLLAPPDPPPKPIGFGVRERRSRYHG